MDFTDRTEQRPYQRIECMGWDGLINTILNEKQHGI